MGNLFEKAKYHIPYYTPSYFNPDGEEDKEEKNKATSKVKIPIKIDKGEEDSRSNVTSFLVSPITHFDSNVKGVLTSLSLLEERVIKPRGIKDSCKLSR